MRAWPPAAVPLLDMETSNCRAQLLRLFTSLPGHRGDELAPLQVKGVGGAAEVPDLEGRQHLEDEAAEHEQEALLLLQQAVLQISCRVERCGDQVGRQVPPGRPVPSRRLQIMLQTGLLRQQGRNVSHVCVPQMFCLQLLFTVDLSCHLQRQTGRRES